MNRHQQGGRDCRRGISSMSHRHMHKNLLPYVRLLLPGLLGISLTVSADYLSDAQQYYEKGEYKSAIIQLKNVLQEDNDNAQARMLLGRTYLEQGKYAAAEKELKAARALGSSEQSLVLPLAKALLKQGKLDEALDSLNDRQLTSAEENSEALAILGHLYLAKNKTDDAKLSFKRALQLSEQPYALLGQARIAVLEGRVEDGLAEIEKALQQEPGFIEALFTKGQLLGTQNDFQQAVAVFNEILEREEEHLGARLARAEAQIRLQNLDAARSDIKLILEQNEMQPHANFIMARLHLEAEQYAEAQTSAEKVLRMAPDHLLSFFILGAAHYAQDNFEQAKIYLEKFVAQQPAHIAAVRILGATYVQLGDPASAVDLLQAVDQSYDHGDAQLLNVLGRAYLKTGEFEKGTETLNRAVKMAPEIEGAQTQIALGKLAAGKTEEAIEQLKKQPDGDEMTSIMLVLSYIKQRQFDKALETIDAAIDSYPKNSNFHNLKGLTYEALGDRQRAKGAYEESLKVNAEFIPGLLSLAKLDYMEGDTAAAKKKYQRVLKIKPNHMQSQLAMAQLAGAEADEDSMLTWLKQARDTNRSALQPVEILVNYYLSKNDPDKALNEARKFQADYPENIQILSVLARVQLAKGDQEQAEHHLRKLIDSNKKDVQHRMQLVRMYAEKERSGEALELIEEILDLDGRHLPALMMNTQLLIAQEKYTAAEEVIANVTQWYPNSHAGKQLRGDLLVATDQTELALKEYEQAFAQAKTQYLVHVLFEQYRLAGDLETAAQRLQTYIDAVPQDANNRLRLASTYQKLEQHQKAKKLYEELAKQAPNNAIVLNNLAWLYWLEKDERSLDYAQRAHQAAPNKPEISDTLGWIMLHLGDSKEALKIIREAATKAPTHPEIRYHLAVALTKNNQQEQAKKELTRLLRDYRGFSDEENAKQLLEELKQDN